MTIHYNPKNSRFYDGNTGHFVSRSRGLSSSVAREEYKEVEAWNKLAREEDLPKAAELEVFDISEAGKTLEHEPFDMVSGAGDFDSYIDEWLDEDYPDVGDEEDAYE